MEIENKHNTTTSKQENIWETQERVEKILLFLTNKLIGFCGSAKNALKLCKKEKEKVLGVILNKKFCDLLIQKLEDMSEKEKLKQEQTDTLRE
ncbi:MAG: hypothetical protein LRZ98_00450 [Candidatus Pacebacteria bacterium]|nr:hypothetical protein [Candidatus Paceibacterota bacterium]